MSMGKKREEAKKTSPQPVSWKSQLNPPSSHLPIAIADFYYRLWALFS